MSVSQLLAEAESLGARISLANDSLILDVPEAFPDTLVEKLRERKEDIRAVLAKQSHELVFPDPAQRQEELGELVRRVEEEGYVLLWSTVLEDLLAFRRDDVDPSSIPPGFVQYSDAELRTLFGDDKPDLSPEALRFIHAAKKTGARVTGNDPDAH